MALSGDTREPGSEEGRSEGRGVDSPVLSVPCRENQGSFCQDKPLARLTQPWRAYWPPVPGSELDRQLRSQFPDVFDWKFHPDRLFEHPWRAWTSSDRHARPDSGLNALVPPGAALAPSQIHSVIPRPDLHRTTPTELETQRRRIDSLVDDFPAVKPEFFRYVAPLARYEEEKLYKVQLPSLGAGFRRTNLECQPYEVSVFDVSGKENLFTMAGAGFQFTRCPVAIPPRGSTEAETEASYLPLLSHWLKGYLNCEEVLVFAYNVSDTSQRNAQRGS